MALPPETEGADTHDSREYNRLQRQLDLAELLLGLALLLVLLATGWSAGLRDLAFRLIGESYNWALVTYVVLLTVIAKFLAFPLDLYAFRLEHRFQLSNQKLGGWLWDQFKGWLVGLFFSLAAALFVYWAIRSTPEWWWVICWAVSAVFFILVAQLAPVLLFPIFYKFKPLENERLRERLTRLGERAGTRVRGVYEWKLSEKSKKANAALTGLGGTRRILLADTLLANYSDDEIEAILAHELGHHVHRHIAWGIAVQTVVMLVGFWAADAALRWSVYELGWFDNKMSDFANLPLLVLVVSVLAFLLMPVLNAWSRRNERQADLYAWKSIPRVEPFISSMEKLADQNLAERNPSRWVEVWFHSHPPIAKRVAAARAWAASVAPPPRP